MVMRATNYHGNEGYNGNEGYHGNEGRGLLDWVVITIVSLYTQSIVHPGYWCRLRYQRIPANTQIFLMHGLLPVTRKIG